MAVRGRYAQVETLTLFFPRGIAERQSRSCQANGGGPGDLTVDGCLATVFRDQAELPLRIGSGLDRAEQEAQQQPGAGQGQKGDAKGLPCSQQGEESQQQSGGNEHHGGDPVLRRGVLCQHDAGAEPQSGIERRRGGE